MKTNIARIAGAFLAVGICIWSVQAFAQTTTTVTTTKGAFTEYVPGSETMVVRTESGSAPLRYTVTKQTTVVDEGGAPVAIERIPVGSELSVQYSGSGDHLTASRVIVHRRTAVTAPVTSGPVTTTGRVTTGPVTTAPVTTAPVSERQTTTTTSTTRELTHEEKHELKEQREREKDAAKKEIERKKEALDKEKEAIEHEHD